MNWIQYQHYNQRFARNSKGRWVQEKLREAIRLKQEQNPQNVQPQLTRTTIDPETSYFLRNLIHIDKRTGGETWKAFENWPNPKPTVSGADDEPESAAANKPRSKKRKKSKKKRMSKNSRQSYEALEAPTGYETKNEGSMKEEEIPAPPNCETSPKKATRLSLEVRTPEYAMFTSPDLRKAIKYSANPNFRSSRAKQRSTSRKKRFAPNDELRHAHAAAPPSPRSVLATHGSISSSTARNYRDTPLASMSSAAPSEAASVVFRNRAKAGPIISHHGAPPSHFLTPELHRAMALRNKPPNSVARDAKQRQGKGRPRVPMSGTSGTMSEDLSFLPLVSLSSSFREANHSTFDDRHKLRCPNCQYIISLPQMRPGPDRDQHRSRRREAESQSFTSSLAQSVDEAQFFEEQSWFHPDPESAVDFERST